MSFLSGGGSNASSGGWPSLTEASKPPESEISSRGQSEGSATGSRLSGWPAFLKIGGRKDGEKKRGPKPGQRPPKDERQARNRRAQTNHRDRKERYVKGLEEEVLRLREAFTLVTREKSTLTEENRRLREIMVAHGIDVDGLLNSSQTVQGNPDVEGPENLNYAEIAQQFILALESVCIEHIQILAGDAAQHSDVISGHALMATCPPETHSLNYPNQDWGLRTVNLPPEDLAILYNLQIQEMQRDTYLERFDGELSPIAAWTLISSHPRFSELSRQDFETLMQVLKGKTSCEGFGAVVQEFEVKDGLASLFAKKNVIFS